MQTGPPAAEGFGLGPGNAHHRIIIEPGMPEVTGSPRFVVGIGIVANPAQGVRIHIYLFAKNKGGAAFNGF